MFTKCLQLLTAEYQILSFLAAAHHLRKGGTGNYFLNWR